MTRLLRITAVAGAFIAVAAAFDGVAVLARRLVVIAGCCCGRYKKAGNYPRLDILRHTCSHASACGGKRPVSIDLAVVFVFFAALRTVRTADRRSAKIA